MMVTEKGQVTIPKEIRDKLGIRPGSQVDFLLVEDHIEVRLLPGGLGRGRSLVEKLWGSAGRGMSTDEIMALTRGDD